MKIAIAGTGYVGLSIAVLLSQHHEVTAVDILPEKVEMINRRISPIQDKEIEEYLATKELRLTATLDGKAEYSCAGVPLFRRNGYRQSGARKPLFQNRDTAPNCLLPASLLA